MPVVNTVSVVSVRSHDLLNDVAKSEGEVRKSVYDIWREINVI